MNGLTDAVINRIKADAQAVSDLSMFHGQPAVFGELDYPDQALRPLIYTYGNQGDVPFDAKNWYGREVIRDIVIVDDATGGYSRIERLAERVRFLFHRHRLILPNHEVLVARASGPVIGPSDKTLYSRVVTLTLKAEQG